MTGRESVPISVRAPDSDSLGCGDNRITWIKQEGDEIKPHDVLAEIETDKATIELEAIEEGVLNHILVEDGTNVSPGTIIGEMHRVNHNIPDVIDRFDTTLARIVDPPYFNRDFVAYDAAGNFTPEAEASVQFLSFRTEVEELVKSIDQTYNHVIDNCRTVLEHR